MGLDCRIVCVPKHDKNLTVSFEPSPFLANGFFDELPSAWGDDSFNVDKHTDFSLDVYYCRKNWFLFEFTYNYFRDKLEAIGEDVNGCYMMIDKKFIESYLKELRNVGATGFYDLTDDFYTSYATEINKMIRIRAVMEMYGNLLDFYFEGDY